MYIVYKHTSPSGKCYIGITRTTLKQRSGKNGQYYCRGTQPLFQHAIEKYGWNNFKHEILFSNLSKEKAELFEQKLIYFYKLIGRSYNLAKGGLGCGRESVSEEEIAKLKERCNKPISVYSLNGDLLYQFGSITETAITLNIPLSSISRCLLRNVQYKNIYQFKYTNSLFVISKVDKRKEILPVKQLTLEGDLVKIYSSAYEAYKETGIDYSNITKCCKHKKGYNQCMGYKWEYNI